MDKPFNYVDPFSQDAVMEQAEFDAMTDYSADMDLEDFFNPKETLPVIDMSIDEDLLNDNLTDDSFLFEDKFHGLPF